jgi:hypothetical protein
MDITKNIAKAVLNKNYAEAKESIFKSLYAKASLAMDEARYYIADALFNRSAEGDAETVSEGDWGGGFQTSKEAWREEMKRMRAEAKWNRDKAKRAAKKAKAAKKAETAKKAVKEEAEQIDEISKATKDSYVAKRGSQLSSMLSGHTRGKQLTGKQQANAVKGIKQATGVNKNKSKLPKLLPRMATFTFGEEVEQIDEVSPPGMEKMTGSKKTKASFAKQYGKRGKEVMYATAWKLHNKKMAEEVEQVDEAMTRKHFQQVADLIKANPDAKKREELAAHHSQIFKKSNPRFDQARFNKACGVDGCK